MGCGISSEHNYVRQVQTTSDFRGKRDSTASIVTMTTISAKSNSVSEPYSKTYEISDNTNRNHVLVDTIRAYLPKRIADMPKELLISFRAIRTFLDEEFPPEVSSITKDPRKANKYKNVIWQGPELIFSGTPYQVFCHGSSPSDVVQGKLENCYFMTALTCLAEKDYLISSLFPEVLDDETSINIVWINNSGEWQPMICDSNFPCDSKTNQPIFGTCKEPETWVMILEKIYAKLYGGYENTEIGCSSYALKDLTGAPCELYSFNDPDEAWEYLRAQMRDGYLVTANSNESELNVSSISREVGIIPSHCYAILDTREITLNSEEKERLIKMRNPLGTLKWKGQWSEDSPRWTTELKKILEYEPKKKDGTFWISINDFVQQFTNGAVCKAVGSYEYSYLKLFQTLQRSYTLVLMSVNTKMDVFLTINQIDKRHYINKGVSDYNYSYFSIMVVRIDTGFEIDKFIEGSYQRDRDCTIKVKCSPGNYLVLINFDWCQSYSLKYIGIILGAYAPAKVNFTEVVYKGEWNTLLEEYFRNYFFSKYDQNIVINYSNYGEPSIRRYMKFLFGYLVIFYENRSDTTALDEIGIMRNLENLDICPPYDNSNKYRVQVPPNKTKLVCYKINPKGGGSYKYDFTYNCQLLPMMEDKELITFIHENYTKISSRNVSETDIGVIVYSYVFKGGVIILYNNESKYVYQETIKFVVENMVTFDENLVSSFEFTIKPGQNYLIKLKANDISKPYSYDSKVNFKVQKE